MGDPGAGHAGRGHVLVIEDDPDIATLIDDALSEAGYSVRAFASADAAAEAMRSGGFDLLLTDLRMRGASPFTLAAQARGSSVPVILTTGDAGRAEELEEEWAVLRKPFRMSALLRAVDDALAASRGAFGPHFLRAKAQQCRALAEQAGDPALRAKLGALSRDLDCYARRMAG
jgi:DNA-binding NtrC family response regulator